MMTLQQWWEEEIKQPWEPWEPIDLARAAWEASRKQALLEAAEWFKGYQGEDDFVEAHLRRMAEE